MSMKGGVLKCARVIAGLTRNPIITPSTQHVASLLIGQDEMPDQVRQDTESVYATF